jgi:hypothetical protein
MMQVIGIFALVASLVFVGFQIKQSQEIGQGEAATYFLETTNSFRNSIIDSADVWRRGCMGEELTDGARTKFANRHYSYGATAYWVWLAADIGVLSVDRYGVTNAVAANIHRYPGLSNIARSKRQWTAEGSKAELAGWEERSAAIQARLAELREIEPAPVADPD